MSHVTQKIRRFVPFFLCAILTLHLPDGTAQEDYPEDDLGPITPLQLDFDNLNNKIQKLEKDNSFNNKLFTFGTAVILDIALELTHTGMLAYYSPSYIYGRPLSKKNDVNDILKRYLSYTLEHGHAPALAMGVAAWFSENGTSLPALPTTDSVSQIAAIATGVAALYGVLVLRAKTLMRRKQEVIPFSSSTADLLARIAPSSGYYLTAVDHLDWGKHLLQAGAVTAMVGWGLMQRFQKKFAIEDLRQTLTLARDRLQRDSRKKTAVMEELKLKKKLEFQEVKDLLKATPGRS